MKLHEATWNTEYSLLDGDGQHEFIFYLAKFLRGENEFEGDKCDLTDGELPEDIKTFAPYRPVNAIEMYFDCYVEDEIKEKISMTEVKETLTLREFLQVEGYEEWEKHLSQFHDVEIIRFQLLDNNEQPIQISPFIAVVNFTPTISWGIYTHDIGKFLLSVRSDLFGVWKDATVEGVGNLIGYYPQKKII